MKLIATFTIIFSAFVSHGQGLTENYTTDQYSIRYPKAWTLVEDEMVASFHIVAPKLHAADRFTENVSLVIQDLGDIQIGLGDYVRLAVKQIRNNGGEILTTQRFEAGSINAHKVIYKAVIEGFNLKLLRYYQIKNQKAYILTYTALEPDFEKHKLYGQQILRSFRLK